MGNYATRISASGDLTLVYHDKDEIKLHSSYDPVKEAERGVSAFNKGRSSIIVVSGLALGYHILSLKKKYPEAEIIVIEHDREVVNIVRENLPAHIDGIVLIQGKQDITTFFEILDLKKFMGISHYKHRPSYSLYREYYDFMLLDIKHFIMSKISDLLTRFQFEENWVINIFKNIGHVSSSCRISDFFGKFRGYAGIIVSAGPSLRKNAGLLKGLREKALVISVDTAAKVLEKSGVDPHMIMTLDSQKHSIRHFLGLKSHKPLLVADIVSFPGILRSYAGSKAISTTSKYYFNSGGDSVRETTPAMDWIEKYMPPTGDIQSGGSVATSAFDLLLNLGCSPIVLVGQDLAYSGREIHSSGTHHNDDWVAVLNRFRNLDSINQGVIRKRKIKYVSAFGGRGTVLTDFVLDLYRGWFSDSAGKVTVPVINATGGGARIDNTEERDLHEVMGSIAAGSRTPQDIIDSVIREHETGNGGVLSSAIVNALEVVDKIIQGGAQENHDPSLLVIIEEAGLTELFNPFLRKTDMYVSRNDIEYDEAVKIYNRDIIKACIKLRPVMESAIKRL